MAALPKLRSPAPYVEQRIHKAVTRRREKEEDAAPKVLRLSSIGRCERDLWADYNRASLTEPFGARLLLIFDHGNVIESHVVDLLREAGFLVVDRDPETGGQFEVVAFGGFVKGHLDGKVLLGKRDFEDTEALLEIKSAKASRFEELTQVGYEEWNPGYADQIHAYMGIAGLKIALVVVYSKDDSQIYAERIRFDAERFTQLAKKMHRIVKSETVLPRPPEATSQYCKFCKWCDRNEWCWGPLAETKFDA